MVEKPHKDEAPFLQLLGLKAQFLPDEKSPRLDENKLARYLAGQSSRAEAREVEEAIQSFRPWYRAWCRAIADRTRVPGI